MSLSAQDTGLGLTSERAKPYGCLQSIPSELSLSRLKAMKFSWNGRHLKRRKRVGASRSGIDVSSDEVLDMRPKGLVVFKRMPVVTQELNEIRRWRDQLAQILQVLG
jgi:hypothetical protein